MAKVLLYGTDTIASIGPSGNEKQTYVVCNALLMRKVADGNQILLGQRLTGFGRGSYILPGGKQKEDERLETCVKRELHEETGVIAKSSRPISFLRMKYPGKPQVISIGAIVTEFEGKVSRREPEQNGEWGWYDLNNLPAPLFVPARRIIQDYENRIPDLEWKDLETQVTVEAQSIAGQQFAQLRFDLYNEDEEAQ